jgi:3'-phosphoadenosine 5'-phosphosulfate sulfotransferase (PAPS reductase)/FAD synthetase
MKFPEFDLSNYDNIIVAFSGGKDSLACLLLVYEMLRQRGLLGAVNLEVWHHEVDGREGSHLMDWPCTPAYCRAVAEAFDLPIYFSWLEGGFEREMMRDNQPKGCTWFETPDGLQCAGGDSGKLGTRLKFPQVSGDLRVRWCSAYLKIDVARIAIKNQSRFKGRRTLVISGERAEESPGRAKYLPFEPHECHNNNRHIDRWRPVHRWSNREVWRIIAKFGVNPHPAYRMGFGRCSCQFCIFGSDDQWATLWDIDPGRLNRLIDLEQQFGLTIHRKLTIPERIGRGKSYPALDAADIAAALSTTWNETILMPPGTWRIPAGYHGETSGPT